VRGAWCGEQGAGCSDQQLATYSNEIYFNETDT